MTARPAAATPEEPDLPALHDSFDACSTRYQRRFLRLTRTALVATVFAAVAGAISIDDGPDWAAVVALLALLAAGGCRLVLLQERPERLWYDARAGAESVKTLAWQYAVGGGPFPCGIDDDGLRRGLVERFRSLIDEGRGLRLAPGSATRDITDWMTFVRTSPLEQRRDVYVRHRLLDQIAWYGAAAAGNDNAARRWASITLAIQAIGITAAVLRVTGTLRFDLIGIAAAAAAAAIAWLESKDHSGLAEAYATTAHELTLVRDDLPETPGEERWATFVADAESAISREHTSWLARRRARDLRPPA